MSEDRVGSPLDDQDFDDIESAVMETGRGRWFLQEFARRNRSADTAVLLSAVQRLEDLMIHQPSQAPMQGTMLPELGSMAEAIESTASDMASIRNDMLKDGGQIGENEDAFGHLARTAQQAASQLVKTAEALQATLATLKDNGVSDVHTQSIEKVVNRLFNNGWSHDVQGQRTAKAMGLIEHLRERLKTLTDETEQAGGSSQSDAPVMPTQLSGKNLKFFEQDKDLFEQPEEQSSNDGQRKSEGKQEDDWLEQAISEAAAQSSRNDSDATNKSPPPAAAAAPTPAKAEIISTGGKDPAQTDSATGPDSRPAEPGAPNQTAKPAVEIPKIEPKIVVIRAGGKTQDAPETNEPAASPAATAAKDIKPSSPQKPSEPEKPAQPKQTSAHPSQKHTPAVEKQAGGKDEGITGKAKLGNAEAKADRPAPAHKDTQPTKEPAKNAGSAGKPAEAPSRTGTAGKALAVKAPTDKAPAAPASVPAKPEPAVRKSPSEAQVTSNPDISADLSGVMDAFKDFADAPSATGHDAPPEIPATAKGTSTSASASDTPPSTDPLAAIADQAGTAPMPAFTPSDDEKQRIVVIRHASSQESDIPLADDLQKGKAPNGKPAGKPH